LASNQSFQCLVSEEDLTGNDISIGLSVSQPTATIAICDVPRALIASLSAQPVGIAATGDSNSSITLSRSFLQAATVVSASGSDQAFVVIRDLRPECRVQGKLQCTQGVSSAIPAARDASGSGAICMLSGSGAASHVQVTVESDIAGTCAVALVHMIHAIHVGSVAPAIKTGMNQVVLSAVSSRPLQANDAQSLQCMLSPCSDQGAEGGAFGALSFQGNSVSCAFDR